MSGSVPESLIPPDEEDRLRALHALGILDTGREERFDAMVSELAEKLDVPVAYLSLIAEDRQWIKSKVGPLPAECKREDAFCSRTILQEEPLLVSDAAQDPRFSSSPLVQEAPHLRFYAGVPVSDESGHTLGTVCVASPTPRKIEPRELAILEGFARRLEQVLTTRPTVVLAYASEDEALIARFVASHPDLEDPGVLDLWSSRRVMEGEAPAWKLKDAIWQARSVVMMLSPAFLRSDFVQAESFRALLAARELEEIATTVVLLEPCDRAAIDWLADRAPWPSNDQAITLGSDAERDQLFRELAIEIVGHPPPVAPATVGVAEDRRASRLFLSHAGEDAAAVKDLAGRLRQAGVEVWLDIDELQPGDDWMQALEDGLDGSDAFAVYIGRSGIARWIGREVRVALDRNAKDPRFRFIPILGPGSDPESLPRFVAQHHWLDLRHSDPQPEEIRKLVGAILSRPAEAVSLLPPGEPPFRGLLTFGVEHAHLFFGRDRETEELLERLRSSPFLAVIGDSGSGKSSLVRAGLVPALHRGHFRDAASNSATWRVAVVRPGGNPFRELASGLLDLLPEAGPEERLATLEACKRQLAEGTQGLCSALSALVPRTDRTLLIVDQFEELFTQSQDPDERDRFIDTLLEASNCDGDRPLHTVVTLRADFYSHCFEHPTLPAALSTCQYAVRAIAPDQLAGVIEKPALLAGVELEPGLVEAILFDLGEGTGNLPLLEHTLLQLWRLRTGETLTHASYEEIGRVQGALEHHAEEVFRSFGDEERVVARHLFLSLVVPTESSGPTRRRATVSQVLPTGDRKATAEAVLGRLVDERLLLVRAPGLEGGAEHGEEQNEVEVTHEALLRGWRRLGDWLDEDREFLFWRQRVRSAFEAWVEAKRDRGALLRGAPLAEARHWLETRGGDLSDDGRTFIHASIAMHRRQRRVRGAVTAAVAVIGAAALVLWWIAARAQRVAEASLLTATTAVDEMLTEVGSEALKDVPQLEGVRQELLAKAGTLYEQLARQGAGGRGLELRTALGPARIAQIQRQTGDVGSAREGLRRAIERLNELTREEPRNSRFLLELAKLHNEMGWLITDSLGEAGEASEATEHYGRALELQHALVGEDAASSEYSYELARTHLNRGILQTELNELEAAEADYLAAIDTVASFADRAGDWHDQIRQQLARSRNQLASLFLQQRKLDLATAEYKLASDLFESLIEDHPTSREYRVELAKTYRNLAANLRPTDPRQADGYSHRAVELFADLADALPDIRSEWAKAHHTRGQVLEGLDNPNAAIASYDRASTIFAELLRDYPPEEHPGRVEDLTWEAVTLLYLALLRDRGGESDEVERIRPRFEEILLQLDPERRARLETAFP